MHSLGNVYSSLVHLPLPTPTRLLISSSALKTLVSAMAGASEDPIFSPVPAPDSSLIVDSNSQIETSGSVADSPDDDDAKHGFTRPEMNRIQLAGTVDLYERHLFLCYEDPQSWPAKVEAAGPDHLPGFFSSALKSRKNEIQKKIRLTVCEGRDGTETLNGDVLIFPDMIKYRNLTHFDVDSFIEDVLVKETDWQNGAPEALTGPHVFVCAHGSRDKRCGVCGPVLVNKFKEEIEACGLEGQVCVSPCSHIGGHKYAGNVIIFSPDIGGKVEGHWYGYVTPDDVPILIEQHIGKGKIIDRLWRGQMGLSEEEQKKLHDQRLQPEKEEVYPNGIIMENNEKEQPGDSVNADQKGGESCCGGANGFSCCRDEKVEETVVSRNVVNGIEKSCVSEQGACSSKGFCGLSSWLESWDRADTLATVGVIGAVASIGVAYSFYRRSG